MNFYVIKECKNEDYQYEVLHFHPLKAFLTNFLPLYNNEYCP